MIRRMDRRATPVIAPHPSVPTAAPRRIRRGAAILPSLFTTGNLFLGFWAVILSSHGNHEKAAALIFGAIVLDLLDGRIARLTGTASEFGGELDSLADVISFGVAPAFLAYAWGFATMPRVGWLVAFLFVMCGTLRLARFNVQKHVVDGRFFVGLPIPAAAAMVASLVNFAPGRVESRGPATVLAALIIVLAFLMVSTFRYWSFKKVDLRRRRSYVSILGIALAIALVAMHTEWMLLGMATAFWLSGPAWYMWSLVSRRRAEPPPPAVAAGLS
jgi:CDP-diacylglycerol---serine O-phosphatidyltransferase